MKHARVEAGDGFRVLAGSDRSQAAAMTLEPGESTGGPDNRHDESDQWLFVLAGSGTARVGSEEILLEEGTLLLIEPGETHEIRSTGRVPLRTLNVYSPPEY